MGRYDNAIESLKKDRDDLVSAVNAKGQNAPANTKISEIPSFISAIVTKTGGEVKLVITAPDYEGQTLTATCGSERLTETVVDGTCEIYVNKAGVWTVSAEDGTQTEVEVVIDVPVKLDQEGSVFTVRIKKEESDPRNRVEYLDDAEGKSPVTIGEDGQATLGDWENTFIFKKIYPVMLKTDGTEDYLLNPQNQTEKKDGSVSDVSRIEYDGNAMVCFEKMYSRFWSDNDYEYLSISKEPKSGYEAIGFIDENGNETEKHYTGMFLGSLIDNKLRSIGNNKIFFNSQDDLTKGMTSDRLSGYVSATNNIYTFRSYALVQLINTIFVILFKSDDHSIVTANGRSGVGNNQTSYQVPNLVAGILQNTGPISIDKSSNCVKFLWIEDYFSNRNTPLYEELVGIKYSAKKSNIYSYYIKMNPPYSDRTDISSFFEINTDYKNAGYIKGSQLSNTYGRFPYTVGGSSSTYQCDRINYTKYTSSIFDHASYGCKIGGLWGLDSAQQFNNANFYFANSACASLDYLPTAKE